MSKIVLILGMHRSGTSVLARWLHEMGLPIGERLHPEGQPNENGHYEDVEFLNLHRALLADNDLPYTVRSRDKVLISDTRKAEAVQLVAARSNRSQWGFKDPRTLLFLDFWTEVLEGHELCFLHIARDEQAVLNSLMSRVQRAHSEKVKQEGLDWDKAKKTVKLSLQPGTYKREFVESIKRHQQDWTAFKAKTDPNHICEVRYEDFLDCQHQVFEKLTNDWGLNLQFADMAQFFVPTNAPKN